MRRIHKVIATGLATTLCMAGIVVGTTAAVHAVDPPLPTRALLLKANDLLSDRARGLVYASIPSSAGQLGNSIVSINPTTGAVVSVVFAGSEPSRLAISDDSSMLYVGLDGSNSVRQYSLPGLTLVREIFLGTSGFNGMNFTWDLEVMPGHPNTIAVSRNLHEVSPGAGGVAVFDSGVQRPTTTAGFDGADEITFDSTTRVYGLNLDYGGFRSLAVDAGGVSPDVSAANKVTGRIIEVGGRIYGGNGAVIDPATNSLLGSFPVIDFGAFTIDAVAKRAYYLDQAVVGSWVLHVFNTDTFAEVSSHPVPGMDVPASLVAWVDGGVAYASRDGRIFVVSPGTIAQPIPAVPVAPVPPAYPFKVVNQTVGRLVYDSTHGVLYGSTPSNAAVAPDSVVAIDPNTASVLLTRANLGGVDPLALSDDDSTLYAGLRNTGEVAQFSLPALTPVRKFQLPNRRARADISQRHRSHAGQPSTIAVAEYWAGVGPGNAGTEIFDSGVPRPVTTPSHIGSDRIEFASPTRIYGLDTCCSGRSRSELPSTRLESRFSIGRITWRRVTTFNMRMAGCTPMLRGRSIPKPRTFSASFLVAAGRSSSTMRTTALVLHLARDTRWAHVSSARL